MLILPQFFSIFIFACCFLFYECFVPAKLMDLAISKVNKVINFTQASKTITHEEIIQRGIIHSVTNYFFQQANFNGSTKINLTKLETGEYYDLKSLYKDYYGSWYCTIGLEDLIQTEFQPNVAIVDFDSKTKDLPYAHFDAETFQQSNQRVIQFQNDIFDSLKKGDYSRARKLAGQISHTIQDFYSHSNWVEMGNSNINFNIGKPGFNNQTIVSPNENFTCNNNCNQTVVECSPIVQVFVTFLKALGLKSSIVECPLKYYVCVNNLLVNDKLISGYYSNQKLEDGSLYEKPSNLIKCSHGGVMDKGSLKDAIGGINKDSGYYMFSPHAYLHLSAASLAIKHTAYLFDEIRTRVGDTDYAKFLELAKNQNGFNNFNELTLVCDASKLILPNYFIFLILNTILFLFFMN